MDWLGIKPNLTLDMVIDNKQNSSKPINPWVGGVLLLVTDHIQRKVRLGLAPNQSMGWRSTRFIDQRHYIFSTPRKNKRKEPQVWSSDM